MVVLPLFQVGVYHTVPDCTVVVLLEYYKLTTRILQKILDSKGANSKQWENALDRTQNCMGVRKILNLDPEEMVRIKEDITKLVMLKKIINFKKAWETLDSRTWSIGGFKNQLKEEKISRQHVIILFFFWFIFRVFGH